MAYGLRARFYNPLPVTRKSHNNQLLTVDIFFLKSWNVILVSGQAKAAKAAKASKLKSLNFRIRNADFRQAWSKAAKLVSALNQEVLAQNILSNSGPETSRTRKTKNCDISTCQISQTF